MNYLHWNEKTITDFSEKNISEMYDRGYVFTRLGKGIMYQTRSVRIDLGKFEPSSENRRILRKAENIILSEIALPHSEYHWSLGKLAQDFYQNKFGPGIMSALKVKEMLTDREKSNFNILLRFTNEQNLQQIPLGYAICYINSSIIHYSYPFYDLEKSAKDMGLGMMTKTIQYAKEKSLEYIYLGSLQRPTDTYKLQFKGLEWFDGDTAQAYPAQGWRTDIEEVKKVLKSSHYEN